MWKHINDLRSLWEPQEEVSRLIARTMRRFGPRVVDLSYANPYDGPDEEVIRALEAAIREDKELAFQYTPYGGKTGTRRLIASKLSDEYSLPFNFHDVILTPGAMAALNVVFRALFSPEDEVILVTPCWQDYPLYLYNLDIPVCFVPSREDKHLELQAIEDALTSRTRGILFSQPNCPTGVLYSMEEIRDLSEILQRAERRFGTRIYLISDEVHRHIIWSGREFFSPLMSYPRSVSVYSFGKALFLQGQRIGYLAVSPQMPENETLRADLERCVRVMGFCTPTHLMQRAICYLLDHRPPLGTIARRHELVRKQLKAYGYEVCDGDATFFVYVKCPLDNDLKFAEHLALYGVLLIPSSLFHEKGYFRLSLTAREESIRAGLIAFETALEELPSHSASL